jgi:hypothetical protein
MLHHRRHRVVFVALGIVGKALADLIDGIQVKPLCLAVEVQAPIFGAVGGVMRAKMTAVKEHDDGADAVLEISGSDPVNFDIFFTGHRLIPSSFEF